MNSIDDQNYYDNDGYPSSEFPQDGPRRSSRARSRGFSAKKEINDESSTSQSRGEQRPTKFPVKNELDVILRKVRSVLNKISALNYNKLQKRWLNLIPTEPNQLTEILQLLVTKAMDEPMYMQIYARLANDVLGTNPSNSVFVRNTLSNHIHHELQSLTTDIELAKYCRPNGREDVARRRKVMLYRFIAELFVENVCSTKFVTERVTDLIGQGKKIPQEADEPLECLCILLMFAGSKLEEFKGTWLNDVFVKLSLTETSRLPIVSKRMQFMLLDLIEMRSNGWISQNKWWAPRVPISDTTINTELDNLKATTSKKNRRTKKNNVVPKRSRERTVRTILNQVVPVNLDRMAQEFIRIFQKNKNTTDFTAESIITHIMENSDTMFIRIQSALLAKVCFACPLLKSKLVGHLFKCIKGNPDSVSAIRFCTELYILGVVSLGEIVSTLQKNPATGTQCACVFFHRAQFKLFRDWRRIKRFEKMKIDGLLESLAKNAQNAISFRLKCMVLDIHDMRRYNWELTHALLWNPIGLSVRASFTVENAIKVFNANEEDGLEFLQENLGTDRVEIEKFVENLCIWAIWRADPMFLISCGKYISSIMGVRLLTAKRLQPILGSLVQTVTVMKGKPDAWAHLGIILHEIYNP